MHKNTKYTNKKALSVLLKACKKLERVKGFEPSTHGLGSRYSTTELHPLGIMSEQSESACSDGFYYSSWGLKKQAAKQLLKKERKD